MITAANARASSSTTTMAPMGAPSTGGSVVPLDPHTEAKSPTQQGRDRCPDLVGQRADRPSLGAVTGVVDIDVDEASLGSGLGTGTVGVALEEPDPVDHRRGPDLVDDHAEVDRLGVADL